MPNPDFRLGSPIHDTKFDALAKQYKYQVQRLNRRGSQENLAIAKRIFDNRAEGDQRMSDARLLAEFSQTPREFGSHPAGAVPPQASTEQRSSSLSTILAPPPGARQPDPSRALNNRPNDRNRGPEGR